jgi:hypothetical protein
MVIQLKRLNMMPLLLPMIFSRAGKQALNEKRRTIQPPLTKAQREG